MAKLRQLLALLLVASVTWLAAADEESHRYKEQEEVILWVNKVGPYNNPQETYGELRE
jgi:transmembrane 9 superfamily protein 3